MARKARASGSSFFAAPFQRFALAYLPPLAAGAVLTAVFVEGGFTARLPGCWLLLYGTGQGCVVPTLLRAVLSGVPGHDAGSASGVLATVQQVALARGINVVLNRAQVLGSATFPLREDPI